MDPLREQSERDAAGKLGWKRAAWLALATYWPGFAGQLVYDDLLVVLRNPLITSLANVPRMFTSSMWGFYSPEAAESISYYRPLASVVFALGYAIGHGDPLPFKLLAF